MEKLEEVAGVDDSCKVKIKGTWRWQCNLCEKNYATKYSLQTHKVGHTGLKPFECLDCGKAFKQLSHLNTHQLRHAGLRPHGCDVCGKRFVQSSHLKRHMNTHNPASALYCDICSRKFTYPSEVRSHKEKMHGPNRKPTRTVAKIQKDVKPIVTQINLNETGIKANGVDCTPAKSEENSILIKQENLEQRATYNFMEENTVSTSPQWLCSECSLTFQTQNGLIAHMASSIHQGQNMAKETSDMTVDDNCAKMVDGVRRWQCKKCEKTYASKYGLITHMSDHIGTKPFECKVCQKRFKQLSHLNTHKLRHNGLRPHRCNICQKTFVQRSHLKRHIHTHTSVGAYFCDFCPRKFTYPSELRIHTKKMHSSAEQEKMKDASPKKHVDVVNRKRDPKPVGATVILCPECGKSFNYQSQLDKHMKRHTNSRPHICKECGMQFMEIHHLNQHAFTHTGLKPYKCLICSRGFALEANMRRHFLIHSGVRPFECHLCRRRFTQRQTLKAHMIVHSDKRPHVCKFCGKSFRRNHNLICHLHLHTDSKPFKCLSCGMKFNRKGSLKKHQKEQHGMIPKMDFMHFKALNMPPDKTLVDSLNNTKDLHDVIDSLNSEDESKTFGEDVDMVGTDQMPGIEKGCGNSQEVPEGQHPNDGDELEQGSHLSDGAISNEGNNKLECQKDIADDQMPCLQNSHEAAVNTNTRIANTVGANDQIGTLPNSNVDLVENSEQSLSNNVLLQEDNTGENFMFNREPVEGSNIFEEEMNWETDLGLIQHDDDVSSSEELDTIMNKPRTMVSKYFVKENPNSRVRSENGKSFVPSTLVSSLRSEVRVSKRKGTPRKLNHGSPTLDDKNDS